MIGVTLALFVLVLSAPSTTAQDDTYSVFLPQSSSTGLASCYKAAPNTRTVRFYSVVSAAGNEFVRQNVPDDVLSSCIKKGTTVLKASNIVACLNAADKAGMSSWTFSSGVCTGYTGWRKIGPATCATGANLVYVRKKYTPPVLLNVNAAIQYTLDNNLSAIITLNPIYTCGYESFFGAKVMWGNNDTVITKSNTTQVTVPRKVLCFYPQNISVWPIDSNGKAFGLPSTLQLDIAQHYWFGMPNGGCFNHYKYHGIRFINRTMAQTYCRCLGLDLYSQTTNSSDTAAIIKTLDNQYSIIPYYYNDIFIDLTYDNATKNFIWRGGQISNTSDSSIWKGVYDDYRYGMFLSSEFRIINTDNDEAYTPSCYDPSP